MNINKQFEEDGYIITEYDNGTTEKILKSDDSFIIESDFISENELFKAKTLSDLEYIKCLVEINVEL